MERLLGSELYGKVISLINSSSLTEIRVRLNKNIFIKDINNNLFDTKISATRDMLDKIIGIATKYSVYAYEEEIQRGFIFYNGGIRIGLGGLGVIRDNKFRTFKEITSLCIRIPHEIIGCSKKLDFLYKDFENTLIIAPPGCGKTTIIRDLSRVLGDSYDVLVLDERYEFCGVNKSLDIGKMTDIIQGVPKHMCYEGGIRALCPQIIVCDEIFGESDYFAMEKIVRSGIKILASIHSDSLETLEKYETSLLPYFVNFVVLSSKPAIGSIKSIIRKAR